MSKKMWTIWVGGSEVNNFYQTKEDAQRIAQIWKDDGYDDVRVQAVNISDTPFG